MKLKAALFHDDIEILDAAKKQQVPQRACSRIGMTWMEYCGAA
jgi:hypothetical protein